MKFADLLKKREVLARDLKRDLATVALNTYPDRNTHRVEDLKLTAALCWDNAHALEAAMLEAS